MKILTQMWDKKVPVKSWKSSDSGSDQIRFGGGMRSPECSCLGNLTQSHSQLQPGLLSVRNVESPRCKCCGGKSIYLRQGLTITR